MESRSGLAGHKIVAFVGTRDPAAAKAFYSGALGLSLTAEEPFALVYGAGGTMLRVSIVPQLDPAPFTVLGWQVAEIAAAVDELSSAGVVFERFPGVPQDDRGVWNAPGGARVAWFKDPDGNVLSLTQFPPR